MMRDQLVGAATDPGEVAHTEFVGRCERNRQLKTRWVSERACSSGGGRYLSGGGENVANGFGLCQIEAEEFTTIGIRSHLLILKFVRMTVIRIRLSGSCRTPSA